MTKDARTTKRRPCLWDWGGAPRVVALAWALVILVPSTPVSANVSLYTVEKVGVDATAADAVAAKEKAMRIAEERAARILLKRLTPFASDRVPQLKAALIEDMLDGVSVRSEQYSGTRYIASLDVAFRPDAVRQVLRSYGLRPNERQAADVKVLPLTLSADGIKAEGKEGWKQAWNGLDLAHSMAPAAILDLKPGMTGEQLTKILGGDADTFARLKDDYGADRLILAVASPVDKGKGFATRLFGTDAVGDIDLSRTDRVFRDNTRDAAKRAAMISLGVIEGRWKLMQGADTETGAARTNAEPVSAVVEFSGLRQWQTIRARLSQMPGMRAVDIGTMTARSATVVFDYDGGRQRLSQELERQGFALTDSGGTLVVSAN